MAVFLAINFGVLFELFTPLHFSTEWLLLPLQDELIVPRLSKTTDEIHFMAIQNILLFTAWALTMYFIVKEQRIPWVIFLYSVFILTILMSYSLLILNLQMDKSNSLLIPKKILENQPVDYNLLLCQFDTLVFAFAIVFLEQPDFVW